MQQPQPFMAGCQHPPWTGQGRGAEASQQPPVPDTDPQLAIPACDAGRLAIGSFRRQGGPAVCCPVQPGVPVRRQGVGGAGQLLGVWFLELVTPAVHI